MMRERLKKFLAGLAAAALMAALCGAAYAELSARSAFVLVRRVAPGDSLADAVSFLGEHYDETDVSGLRVRRWGDEAAEWTFDVLHDGARVRATRITWRTPGRREQQRVFSQLTTEGRRFFGSAARSDGTRSAEWRELEGTILVRATMSDAIDGGVSLTVAVRNDAMTSEPYGF